MSKPPEVVGEIEKSPFPVSFTKCHNCKSTQTIALTVLEEEIKKGKMPKGSVAFLFRHQSIIADMRRTWLSAPLITSFYDACIKCGTVRCVRAEVSLATPKIGG